MKIPESWTLFELDSNNAGEKRWSLVGMGPIAYLTCDQNVAEFLALAPQMLKALKAMQAAFSRHPSNHDEKHHAMTLTCAVLKEILGE